MKIVVVGDGAWGKAIGSLLLKNKKKIEHWKRGEMLPDNSIIIMCIPTQSIREVLTNYGKNLKNFIYINGAKGVEEKTHKLPYQIVTEILGKDVNYFSLIGPSFAGEVISQMPTLVNIGYVKSKDSKLVHDLFETDYFRVRLTSGVLALELASAFKNVYAIACGVVDALGFETNTRVKLIMLAIEEMDKLFKKLGYFADEFALPGTIGDLILTCNSEESRNFTFGQYIVKNKTEVALKKVKQTVEGYFTVDSVPYFEKETGIKLPLARFVYNLKKYDSPRSVRKRFIDFVKNT